MYVGKGEGNGYLVQISQEAGQVVWYSHLFKNFPQFVVIHTVKGFGTVNKAEVDVFLELSFFFDDPVGFGNLISGSSAFSKSSLYIWKFSVRVLLKPGFNDFEHDLASIGFPGGSAGKESSCHVGDLGSIPGLGRSPGEENVYLLRYSSLENFMDYMAHGLQRMRHD